MKSEKADKDNWRTGELSSSLVGKPYWVMIYGRFREWMNSRYVQFRFAVRIFKFVPMNTEGFTTVLSAHTLSKTLSYWHHWNDKIAIDMARHIATTCITPVAFLNMVSHALAVMSQACLLHPESTSLGKLNHWDRQRGSRSCGSHVIDGIWVKVPRLAIGDSSAERSSSLLPKIRQAFKVHFKCFSSF